MRIFIGKAVMDEAALIEARTGQPLTEDWLMRFHERRNLGLIARPVRRIQAPQQLTRRKRVSQAKKR